MNRQAALLVIDVQHCAFDGEHNPPIHRSEALLARISELIEAARAAGIPVVFIQHDGAPDQLFAEGTERARIHPDIAPTPSDTVLHKRQSSAFEGTSLESLLADQGVDTVIACGLQSEFCVANTSIAALDLGLDVYVAEDAHSTWSSDSEDAHAIIDAQNARLRELGGRVESTASLVDRLREL